MIVAVASGKGGTGKTLIATNLAQALGKGVQFVDCDVEEPNGHLFLKPEIRESRKAFVPVPSVDKAKCTGCGECARLCRFSGVVVIGKSVLTFPELCHSCGGCVQVCPEGAISETERPIGVVEIGGSGALSFIQGRLRVGEAMSSRLITKVRAFAAKADIVVIDSPPGTSCPMIASIKGADYCVLVTEPTPFGLHDLELALEVVQKLSIPSGVVINRAGLDDGRVKRYLENRGVPILIEIPDDRRIAEAYSQGHLILDRFPEYEGRFHDLFSRIHALSKRSPRVVAE
jgi:MinD superfamily P-loop ATPase